jgi:complex III assembly factor LYRM7
VYLLKGIIIILVMSMLRISSSDTRSVYRSLLRSIQLAFKGDIEMVTAARKEVRDRMECCKDIEDEVELAKLHEEGREAAEFLKTSIMQLASNADGHLTVKLNEKHAGGVVEPIVSGMDLPKDDGKS